MSKNSYVFDATFNFQDEAAEQRIKELSNALETMADDYRRLQDEAERSTEKIRDLTAQNEALERGTGVDILKERLEKFSELTSRAAMEFRAFLQTVNLNNAEGDYDWMFDEQFERIKNGLMTSNEAILKIKQDYASLITEANESGVDVQALRTLTAAINSMGETLNNILGKLQEFEVNGIKAIGTAADTEAHHVTQALAEVQSSLQGTGTEATEAYEPMIRLFEAIKQYAETDETKLYRVSEAFRNIGAVGQGHYSTKAIDNIINLATRLDGLGSKTIRFDAKGFNELHISKASYENLATYLPVISSVSTGKLKTLASLDWTNLNNLKIQKGSIAGLQELAQALTDVANALGRIPRQYGGGGGGGGGGGNNKLTPEEIFNEEVLKQQRKELGSFVNDYRHAVQTIRDVARTGLKDKEAVWTNPDGTLGFSADRAELEGLYNDANSKIGFIRTRLEGFKNSTNSDIVELAHNIEQKLDEIDSKTQDTLQTAGGSANALYTNLQRKALQFVSDMRETKAVYDPKAVQLLERVDQLARNADPSNYEAVRRAMKEANDYILKNQLDSETWFQKLKKNFGSRIRTIISSAIIGKITMMVRSLYTNVVDINSAMTQLQIVTGATEDKMTQFFTRSAKLAKELGSSITDVLKSMETFSRLGYGMEDATTLSKYANILSKVADMSSEEATKGLTSIIKGYGFDPTNAEHVADVLITVGQKYAVSAAELTEAYTRAGAALNASNTSFEKSAGLIAAANAAVQDASVVGTALKTVSARIRKSKSDLDELGESIDDLSQPMSTYAQEIQALTGFNIMVEGSQTQFKDIYDIFNGLAEAMKNLGEDADTARARVAEILGGTRQATVIYSILSNWGDAAGAFADAMDSAGVSTDAMGKYVNSIQGRIGQLKATLQELSNNVLSSDLIAGGARLLTIITGIVNKLVNAKSLAVVIAAALVRANKVKVAIGIQKIGMALAGATKQGKSFGSVISSIFGQGPAGIVSGVSAAITAIALLVGAIVNAQEEAARKAEEARRKAVESAKESSREAAESAKEYQNTSNELEGLIQQYEELAGKENAPMDQIKDVQSKIVDLVGEQAKGIDLVNGKLDDQLTKLKDIRAENYEAARREAKLALTSAENAINSQGVIFGPGNVSGVRGLTYGVDGFVKRYEQYRDELYKMSEDESYTIAGIVIPKGSSNYDRRFSAIQQWLNDYKELYETYTSARDTYDEIMSWTPTAPEPEVKEIRVVEKSVAAILDEIQAKYDAISEAMDDMTEKGAITAKTFKTLVEQGLDKYLIQTEDGFRLDEDAMQDYIGGLIEAYSRVSDLEEMSDDAKRIAVQNLKNLRAAVSMLALSADQAKKAAEAQKKAYEEEKDALKDQLDAYKELIDLRKDLLKQYKEELDYKRELAKKESNVASLQTRLAVSQLDTSAAGRAKTRELTKELQEAQEELDDFTLEHAIDVVTNNLDAQYEEYKKLIDGQLDDIVSKIDALSGESSLSDVSQGILDLTGNITATYSAIEQMLADDERRAAEEKTNAAVDAAENALAAHVDPLTTAINAVAQAMRDVIATRASATSGAQALFDHFRGLFSKHDGSKNDKSGNLFYDLYTLLFGDTNKSAGGHSFSGGGSRVPDWLERIKTGMFPTKARVGTYHSGGTVGGNTTLQSNEEFAKLLKGEFVATPAMMSRFMNRTLPNLVTAASNSFNAPLVTINCDNITKDALPGLNQIVQQAVTQIKREFDSGMMRTGYRKPAQKMTV